MEEGEETSSWRIYPFCGKEMATPSCLICPHNDTIFVSNRNEQCLEIKLGGTQRRHK